MKTWILWKTAKWYELCESLGLKRIGLWYVNAYPTALICDLCVFLVEAFELVRFVLSDNLGNERNDTNLRNLNICRLGPMKRMCTHYCTYIWFMCILDWGVWICLLLFWRICRKMLVFINVDGLCQTSVVWSDNS